MPQFYLKIIIFSLLCIVPQRLFAQAKIGNSRTSIQRGSLLELEATDKGFLNVRLNTTQMLSIPVTAASNGMMIYNTDSACICFYNGTSWRSMCKGQTRQQKIMYLAHAGDSTFLCPEIIYNEGNIQIFRNGIQVNFTATIGTKTVKLEMEAYCKKDDEIKIIQLINQ